MIKNIVVALDDTPAALAGARLAIDLASAMGATVHAVAVVPDPRVGAQPDADLMARLERTAAAVLAHLARAAESANVSLDTTLLHGSPAQYILDRARQVNADLVLVGRSGRPGPGQPFIGSQTRQILEFAETPVIVVPEPRARRGST